MNLVKESIVGLSTIQLMLAARELADVEDCNRFLTRVLAGLLGNHYWNCAVLTPQSTTYKSEKR